MPTWLIRAAPYVAAVLVVLGALAFAYNRGSAHTAARYELVIAKQQATASAAMAASEAATRRVERAAANDLADASAKHMETERNAKLEIDSLRADLRSSRVRLSIPVAACTPAAPAGAGSAVAGGPGAEARAELMPSAADDLVAIAADGDAAVRQLNAVIDAYNALRERFNLVQ